AHDLSVVSHICDRMAVMYAGLLVELAPVEDLLHRPRHPYTEALLAAVPIPDPDQACQPVILEGEAADPSRPPRGCRFHPRCSYVQARCLQKAPRMREIEPSHLVRCHRSEELSLGACRLFTAG
ncbi:MAG: ABC transporter ATP-binding protein, partial [Deltaproteobacteria bacterium]|nr:ABC transporter ATP-binding protein [Deltaproteobacteria bacterium]